MPGTPFKIASQYNIWASETGARDWRTGEGSERVVLSSWRRRLVDGGVGEREVGGIVGFLRRKEDMWQTRIFRTEDNPSSLVHFAVLVRSLMVMESLTWLKSGEGTGPRLARHLPWLPPADHAPFIVLCYQIAINNINQVCIDEK